MILSLFSNIKQYTYWDMSDIGLKCKVFWDLCGLEMPTINNNKNKYIPSAIGAMCCAGFYPWT